MSAMAGTERADNRGRPRPLARLLSALTAGLTRAAPRYGAGRSGSSSPARAARSAFLPRAIHRFTAV
jgi:hypothetical protein